MKFFERYEAWLHVAGWLVFIGLPFLTLPSFIWNPKDLVSMGMAQLLVSALMIVFFYINLRSLTPSLLRDQTTERFLLSLLVMLVSVCAVRLLAFYVFPPAFGMRGPAVPGPGSAGMSARNLPPRGPHSPWPMVVSTGLSFGFAMMVSSVIALYRYHARSRETQQQIVLEKVSAELAMLKLQVSPHFLFNTLNNIRWLARQKSDQTEAAIVTLAQLLRYMIYQAQRDTVPLQQEVQHLKDYIDLQTMRLTALNTVAFQCEGDIDAYQIEPLLFIPFVENAFKYGLHSQQAGDIRIGLAVAANTLTFQVENTIFEAVPPDRPSAAGADTNSGIGIANVRKRLALHYPGRHELLLSNANGVFRVVLTLQVHHEQVALHRH